MATKQVIEIDVTWSGWQRLKLNALINFLVNIQGLDVQRLMVREPKK